MNEIGVVIEIGVDYLLDHSTQDDRKSQIEVILYIPAFSCWIPRSLDRGEPVTDDPDARRNSIRASRKRIRYGVEAIETCHVLATIRSTFDFRFGAREIRPFRWRYLQILPVDVSSSPCWTSLAILFSSFALSRDQDKECLKETRRARNFESPRARIDMPARFTVCKWNLALKRARRDARGFFFRDVCMTKKDTGKYDLYDS